MGLCKTECCTFFLMSLSCFIYSYLVSCGTCGIETVKPATMVPTEGEVDKDFLEAIRPMVYSQFTVGFAGGIFVIFSCINYSMAAVSM